MSEYQYYEFQAIDRPLTEREMGELRSFSSRATITPTRFVNHYEWGSFKGNPSAWMEQYLAALAQREAEAWREVDALLATKQPGKYDAAVKLLKDLRDVAIRAGRQGEVEARLARLREQHARKPSFVGRLQAAGLIGTTKEGRP